ncbi:MAG: hypothetical protein KDD06_09360 [Phaeodactylibacter sp.]|nr:hypothetical protein [Phaeodactylibacter sp.]
MLEIRLNGHFLEMWDSIDELPFSRFQEYNRAVMLDSGLGSDIPAIDRHLNQARRYNANKDTANTEQTLLNMRQAIAFVLDKSSPEGQAFVALIARMNGRAVEDISPEGTKKILENLSRRGLTVGKLRGFLEYVKKNWTPSWKLFFRAWLTVAGRKNTTPA